MFNVKYRPRTNICSSPRVHNPLVLLLCQHFSLLTLKILSIRYRIGVDRPLINFGRQHCLLPSRKSRGRPAACDKLRRE